MTQVIGTSRWVYERRRELLEERRLVATAFEVADVLDRAAGRLANPQVAAVLRERADERRRAAQQVRAAMAARQG